VVRRCRVLVQILILGVALTTSAQASVEPASSLPTNPSFEAGPAAVRASALRRSGMRFVEIASALDGEGFTTADTAAGIASVIDAEPGGFVVDIPPGVARILVGADLDPSEIARALHDVFALTTSEVGRTLYAAGSSVSAITLAIDVLVAADPSIPDGERRFVTGHELVSLGLDENAILGELRLIYNLNDEDSFALIATEWVEARLAHTGLIIKYGTRFQRAQQRELSSVDWYLNTAEHSFNLCSANGCSPWTGGLPSLAALGQGSGTGDDWWLEPDLDAKPDIVSGNSASARAYIHVLRRDTFTDIQHWLFYAASGPVRVRCLVEGDFEDHTTGFPCADEFLPFGSSTLIADDDAEGFEIYPVMGGHTGHWENVTLRFDNATNQLTGAFMSEYGEYRPYQPEHLSFNETGDVLTYAGLYSQANYALEPDTMENANEHGIQRLSFVPGLKDVCLGWEIADFCAGPQMDFFSSAVELYFHNQIDTFGYHVDEPDWNASDNRELVAINGQPVAGAEWIAYPGRWGAEANYNTPPIPGQTTLDRVNFLMRDQTKYYLVLMEAARATIFGFICLVNELVIPLPLCDGFDLYFELRKENFNDYLADIIEHTNHTASNASVSPGMQGKAWLYDECPNDGFTVSRGYGYGTELKSIDIDPSTWPDRFSEDHVYEKVGCNGVAPRP